MPCGGFASSPAPRGCCVVSGLARVKEGGEGPVRGEVWVFGWACRGPAGASPPPSRWPLARRTAGAREQSLGNAVCSGCSVQGRAWGAADKVRGSWGACVALNERLKVFLHQRTGEKTNRQHGGVKAFPSHAALPLCPSVQGMRPERPRADGLGQGPQPLCGSTAGRQGQTPLGCCLRLWLQVRGWALH